MRYFQDTILLLLYCLFSIQYTEIDYLFVLGLLCSLILCCISFCTKSSKIRQILCLLYLTAGFLLPSFCFFFPAVFYVLFRDHLYLSVSYGVFIYLFRLHGPVFLPMFSVPFGLFGSLLAYFLQTHTEQYMQLDSEFRKTQDDSRERNLLLSEKNKTLMENQNYEIYTAILKERNRIAREIHDNVGHILSRSILLLGAVKTINKAQNVTPMLNNLDDSLNSAMDSIRSSVHDLHDESINLKEAVESLTSEFTFCPIDLQYDMGEEIPKEIKYCFISIAKEALSNVIKHSNATCVSLIMREHPALYQLCIEDNGTSGRLRDSGIGLVNMRDRIYALNGTFQVTADSGFRIFITIPKEM